jgi:DNA-binding response OmpR family regulator
MGSVNGAATIFVIEEDDNTRPLLRTNLQREGYRVLLAVDEDDAIDRINSDGPRFDLLLVNLVGKFPAEVIEVGQRIRRHGKYDGVTPLVVMAEKYSSDQEGTDVNVSGNDWITYLEDGEQLNKLIARLLSEVSNQDTVR